MSDPRLRDPLSPDPLSPDPLSPLAGRRDLADAPPPYVDERGNGAMWGIIAVLAILVIGGFLYFKSGTNVASTAAPPPAATTGAAPPAEPRPLPTPPLATPPANTAPPERSAQ